MPGGIIKDDDAATAAEIAQSDDEPSSADNPDVKPSVVTMATPSDSTNHKPQRVQMLQDNTVASDSGVNLADVDHIQTVVTSQPPLTFQYLPGLCPICGDRVSGNNCS